jgi:hypothetical protein
MTLRSFDFRIAPSGRDMLLRPLTPTGHHWASDHLPRGERLVGRQHLVLDRQIRATLTAILRDGLTIAPFDHE